MRAQGYLAFAVGICLTAWACLFAMETQDRQIADRFSHDTDKVARDTEARLKTYFDTLLAIRGTFAVHGPVSRGDFHRYVNELHLADRYPGFQAIQWVLRVPDDELARHLAAVRADTDVEPAGYPAYRVHPTIVRGDHFPVVYTEPMAGNENAFGLDLAALPAHLRALELGRDTGEVVATERITLVQDASGQPGFIARLPVYRKNAPLGTVEQRRAALVGFVAIVFRVNDLMREVLDPQILGHLHVVIHDTGYMLDATPPAPGIDGLLFDSAGKLGGRRAARAVVPGLVSKAVLNVGQRRWLVQVAGYDGVRYGRDRGTIWLIGGCGFLISALIGVLLVTLQRRRALAQTLRAALQEQGALQDSAVVGIGLFSDGRVVRCNRGLEEMLGYPQGALAGLSTARLIQEAPEAPDPFVCGPAGQRMHRELELTRRDGGTMWCIVNGRMLDRQAPDKGCVWVLCDISDRRRTEAALAQQKEQVEQAHRELSDVLDRLRQAQDTLVTSEKMASLGALVAGIAHELNTPIGNSLLTATALGDMVTDFQRQLDGPGIRRSALEAHLDDAKTACDIIAGSLGKAADLITSFKQVAVDQASDQRRRFDLAGVVRDTLATFAAQLRRAGCATRVEVPDNLDFDSYPGGVSQVLSNLINNALLHAFDGRPQGLVTIAARPLADGMAELRFSDDGVGMSGRTLHQIYDPFFTTKMGQGGSGLGMNIVYNIVTGVLKGSIRVESMPGSGTTVVITLPRTVPSAAAA
ncbi:CHASE domain-containing protein [Pseudoduganella umbonata]|uniref:histidine kinase n=1 Tax=Pseudoduganella umbonata TaxID=864828 RepID=A0A4V1EDM6_9BURK|nr:CHASE domain-containing protein [Pseudoduganella umbonata]MBB3220936.1 PAS domain S-box-containing protein [Pseudoduganella umbonata]QCP11611.1 PAS domain S-box protein [Pseudoduganella umbonata]